MTYILIIGLKTRGLSRSGDLNPEFATLHTHLNVTGYIILICNCKFDKCRSIVWRNSFVFQVLLLFLN